MKAHRLVSVWIAVFFLFLFHSLQAQDPPIKWGEVPKEDLAMKTFPADTNASALILCDFGESFLNDDMELVFHRHRRIKILSTRGYDWGTISLAINEEKDRQRISGIEGMTYTLDEKGETVKKELDDDDIFREKVEGGIYRYRFTLPGLTPGCVIDIRYTISSNNIYDIESWTFQGPEPVRWSEYRLLMPGNIAYAAVTQGYERFAVKEDQNVSQIYSGLASAYLGRNPIPSRKWRWAVKDAPAVRPEPFSTTTDDYVNKVDIQLAGYSFVDVGTFHVLGTWQKVINELNDSKYFGDRIETTRDVKKLAHRLTDQLPNSEDKMKAIYDWVATSIVSNNSFKKYAEQDVDDVLETKKGNDAEITFLIISLLRSAGITADPVILSTRGNGKIQDLYPIVSQFNYVFARAKIGASSYFLDATDPLRPFGLLPTSVLNVRGLVVREDAVEWVPVNSNNRSRETFVVQIGLRPDGSIHGSIGSSYQDYAALDIRRSLKEKKDVEVAKDEWKLESMGIVADSAVVEGKDSLPGPVLVKAWISSDTYAQKAGDMIYLNPQVVGRITENPFKLEDRKYPVDYSYLRSRNCVTTIELPDSFELKESLPFRAFSVGSGDATFLRETQIDGRTIQIRTKYEVNKIEIPPDRYRSLREFYARIVAIESEQLVLQKMKPVPVPKPVSAKKTTNKTKVRGKR